MFNLGRLSQIVDINVILSSGRKLTLDAVYPLLLQVFLQILLIYKLFLNLHVYFKSLLKYINLLVLGA